MSARSRSRAPTRWLLALAAVLALLLAGLVPSLVPSLDAPESLASLAQRHGRRMAGQGGTSGRSIGVRGSGPTAGSLHATAVVAPPRTTAATGDHGWPAGHALAAAPRAPWHRDVRPASRVIAASALRAVSAPGYPAPSSRAPPPPVA